MPLSEAQKNKIEVEGGVEKLNALAVLERMQEMQKQLDSYKDGLSAANNRINQLQQQMSLQQTLANQIAEFGRGPTAG